MNIKFSEEKIDISLNLFLLFILFLMALSYLFYSFHVYMKVVFNADDAAAVIHSLEIVKQKNFFIDYNYSTGYIVPIFSLQTMLMSLLLALDAGTILSFRTAVTFEQVFFLFILALILRKCGLDFFWNILFFCILLSGISSLFLYQTMAISGKNLQYIYILLLFFIANEIYLDIELNSKRKQLKVGFLLLLVFILSLDRSSLFTIMLPFLAGITIDYLSSGKSSKIFLTMLIVTIFAFIVGSLFFKIFLSPFISYTPISPQIVEIDAVRNNFEIFFIGIFSFFTDMPNAGNAFTFKNAFSLYKITIFPIILLIPIYMLTKIRSIENQFFRMLIGAFVISFPFNFVMFIFSSLPQDPSSGRYFIPQILLSITISVYFLQDTSKTTLSKIIWVILFMPLFISSYYTYFQTTSNHQGRLIKINEIINILRENNLTYGYGTFWNANIITILTNDQIKVRPIILGHKYFYPLTWLSSNYWYKPENYSGMTFVILEKSEIEQFDLKINYLSQKPYKVIQGVDYKLYVFEENFSKEIPEIFMINSEITQKDMTYNIKSSIQEVKQLQNVQVKIPVNIMNNGNAVFSSYGKYPVNLGIKLYDDKGKIIKNDYGRVPLNKAIHRGQETQLIAIVDMPAHGKYILEFDLVQENISWFSPYGNIPLRINIESFEK